MAEADPDALPGYRRRFRVTADPGRVLAELEDDFHCMSVLLRHDEDVVTDLEAGMDRGPWTTCPGAMLQVRKTFRGERLANFERRGADKPLNCTHLYDLALLAAAHAHDRGQLVYDILVADLMDGRRDMELRLDGGTVMRWREADGLFVAPAAISGMDILNMRDWISGLDQTAARQARMLRWGAMVARGRDLPWAEQIDATRMPPNCFTFQPDRQREAVRVGEIREFSTGAAKPLDRRPTPEPVR